MGTRAQQVDRVLGYLGLLLIGALGWAADRLRVVGAPATQRTPHTPPMHASGRAHA
jgi:hypothetical protein